MSRIHDKLMHPSDPTTSDPRRDTYVVVSGWYGHRNSGDEAILIVLLEQLAQLGIHRTSVLTGQPDEVTRCYGPAGTVGVRDWETVGLHGLSNLVRGRLVGKLQHQAGAAAFVLGGGSLLRDNNTRRNLLRLLDDVFIASMCRVPVFFYALGVGPLTTRLGRWLIGLAARRADIATVRDEASAELLRSLGVPEERIAIVTDPAFLLPDARREDAIELAGLSDFLAQHSRTVFIYPTLAMTRPPLADNHDRHLQMMAAALTRLWCEDGRAVVMVPMRVTGSDDDVEASRRIVRFMDSACPVHIIEQELSPPMIRALTSVAGINVTVRLHAMIYAVSLGIPCVAMNYEPKVLANAKRFGIADRVVEFGPGWDQYLVEQVRRLDREMPQARASLAASLPTLRQGAMRTFELLGQLLNRSAHNC
ncbi:polysaccharide pyruvyl transferase family protein [Elioraea rosea]|uniref:polysaccharide pyruvyl transferase family protein n=1 Tax=Elioraea rosea TaxID=2492390 RepID=UPI00118672A7|nr:polysaccharide pyruvyl transferase family protein [Elioraea rosea]